MSLPDGAGDIAVPTTAFNVIYQLTHLYHHFFDEGIGMRQIIDYYYVVCDFYKVYQNSSKITPSLFTIKEGSTSYPDPLTLRGEGGNRPTRCSGNRYALRMADHQRSRQIVRDGTAGVLVGIRVLFPVLQVLLLLLSVLLSLQILLPLLLWMWYREN